MKSRALWLAFALVLAVPSGARADGHSGACRMPRRVRGVGVREREQRDGGSSLRAVSVDGQVSAPQVLLRGTAIPRSRWGRAVMWSLPGWTGRVYARFQPAGGMLGPVELVAAGPTSSGEVLPLAVDGAGDAFIVYVPASGAGGCTCGSATPLACGARPSAGRRPTSSTPRSRSQRTGRRAARLAPARRQAPQREPDRVLDSRPGRGVRAGGVIAGTSAHADSPRSARRPRRRGRDLA